MLRTTLTYGKIHTIAVKFLFLLTIGSAILASPSLVRAYHHFYIGSPPQVAKWRNLPANFIVDNDSATFQTQVQTAFATWNNVATAKNVLGARTNSTVNFDHTNFTTAWGNLNGDGQHELVFDADGRALSAAGINPVLVNGFGPTRKRIVDGQGVIDDAFFIVNGSRADFDRASTIVHELGHIQGLAHSSVGMFNSGAFPVEARDPINVNSVPTMHPFSVAGAARQTLEPDDVASLSELYPEAAFETSFSTIEGAVTRCPASSTTPVVGANVRAVNTANPNIQLSRFTSFDGNGQGRYVIKGVPAGTYRLVVEPMGANDFNIGRFGNPPSSFDTGFATEYLSAEADENNCAEELPDAAVGVPVSAGATAGNKNFKVNNVELALVVDDTGSMSNEIGAVRTSLSAFVTTVEQITTRLGLPFPDVAIVTFKDNVTLRVISNKPARLQAVISSLFAAEGGDCPESSNSALITAGRLLRNGGVSVLVTDASSRADGPDRPAVINQYRSKSLTLFTLLSGDCTGALSSAAETGQECAFCLPSSNLDEFPLPARLGTETSVRTFSEISTETGGFFVAIPGIKTSSAVERQRYVNVATNLSVSSVVPALGLVSPGDGPRGRTLNVEILGSNTNFQTSSVVSFGSGITVNSRVINSPQKITANITIAPGAALGFRDVTVTTLLGSATTETATGAGAFNIIDPPATPTLISVTPSQGAQGRTLEVTVNGSNTNFVDGTSVANFGTGVQVNSTKVLSPTVAVVNITIGNTATIGLRDVIITTGGEVARESMPGPFLVTGPGALIPRVNTVAPNQGQRGQTLNVAVTGENTNFINGASVISFSGSGITVNSTTVSSPTTAVANITIAPDAALTFRDVIVTTGSQVATVLSAFQVLPQPPRINAVAPNQGQRGQTLNVAVTGENTNFINGASVISFSGSGITVNSTTVSSPTTAVANITIAPDAAATLRDVAIKTGGEVVGALGSFQVQLQPAVQFGIAGYNVGEGDGRATLTVVRVGSTVEPVTLTYRTRDKDGFVYGCADAVNNSGAAYGRCDFATTVGSLSFASGEVSKTIIVPIIDDAHVEANETFDVVILTSTGVSIGTPAAAAVTIVDNDAAGAANPIFSTPFFVREHYLDFLSREPEAGEPWSGVLGGCPDVDNLNPNSPSARCDRLTVSAAFFGSPEFQLKGFYVYRFYKLALNRLPEYPEIIEDMSFVAGATPEEVYLRRAQFAANFTRRTDFQTNFGSMSNTDYVALLMSRYLLTQISTPDPANPEGALKVTFTSADLVDKLNSGALTRTQVLRAVADSDQVGAAEFNRAFVAMQYYGYLRRTPEPAGYESWLTFLNANPTDFRKMVDGFLNSSEYRLRFGRPNP